MKNSVIFETIAREVCEECEADYDQVLAGCRLQKYVDARIIAVHYLRVVGLSNIEIADVILSKTMDKDLITPQVLKSKARGVEKEFHTYTDRCLQSDAFRSHSTVIRKFVDNFITSLRELETN